MWMLCFLMGNSSSHENGQCFCTEFTAHQCSSPPKNEQFGLLLQPNSNFCIAEQLLQFRRKNILWALAKNVWKFSKLMESFGSKIQDNFHVKVDSRSFLGPKIKNPHSFKSMRKQRNSFPRKVLVLLALFESLKICLSKPFFLGQSVFFKNRIRCWIINVANFGWRLQEFSPPLKIPPLIFLFSLWKQTLFADSQNEDKWDFFEMS